MCCPEDVTADHLLTAASALGGAEVNVVAIDMPLSRADILGRREADNSISRRFGAAGAGTHSPSPARPGAYGKELMRQFECAGFILTTNLSQPAGKALIEVYPHATLISLLNLSKRAPYKVGKLSKYWPDLSSADRRERVLQEWRVIVDAIGNDIQGVPSPPAASERYTLATLKRYEDMLDAIICAWTGLCYTEGRVEFFGDSGAAICVPCDRKSTTKP
jgi:predicted RNase H-like nuclease